MKPLNKIIIGVLIAIAGIAIKGQSQVFAPEFECILSDTLFWQPVANTCGPYISTEIFVSNFPFGPFISQEVITDPSITQYFHFNPTLEDRFYFIRNNYNCPGEPVLHSDTISNLSIATAPISVATISNNQVEVNWTPSTSPQVSGYIIYRITQMGTIPIDTVFGANSSSYIDVTSSPETQAESYFVLALDPCNNTSNFENPHRTIFMQGKANGCDEAIELNWSNYIGWNNAVIGQEVQLSIAGGPFTNVADLPGLDSTFSVPDIIAGIAYCIKIIAKEANTGIEAASNTFCITPDIKSPVLTLQLENLSVRKDNTVSVSWFWEDNIEINSFEFRSGTAVDNLSTSFSGLPGILAGNENTRIDPNVDGALAPLYYNITTIDECSREFSSNVGRTLHLSGQAGQNFDNLLQWTDFFIEGAEFMEYRLYRSLINGPEELVLDDPLATVFSDIIDPADENHFELCYFVEALFEIEQPDGVIKDFVARSNEVCVRQDSKIRVPNAFVPGGVNTLFRPLLSFDEGISFNMKIYNRWGALIFETADYLQGWDGRNGLQEMPMGGYVYLIQVVQADGVVQEKSGTVLLIR